MAEVNALKKKLTEIFDDENVYTEFREKIKNSILNRLYYSKCKDTHFYTSPEVFDQFLDMIIKDYVEFEATTKKMVNEIRKLEEENSKLKAENRNLKASLDIAGSNKGVTNVDLLKRISDLEKVVYGE